MENKIEVEIYTQFRSPEHLRNFLQKDNYEKFLKDLLIQFNHFPDDLELVKNQANAEYDYYSSSLNQSYEATLLVNNIIIREIIENPEVWQTEEFMNWVYAEAKQDIIDRLNDKRNKNNIILFNIFPLRRNRFQGGIFMQFAADGWDLLMDDIRSSRSDLVLEKTIYLVSYNFDDSFLLKQLNPKILLNEFIPFSDKSDIYPIRVSEFKTRIV
jgi:hypothetical protein